jgi:hypothetical protein
MNYFELIFKFLEKHSSQNTANPKPISPWYNLFTVHMYGDRSHLRPLPSQQTSRRPSLHHLAVIKIFPNTRNQIQVSLNQTCQQQQAPPFPKPGKFHIHSPLTIDGVETPSITSSIPKLTPPQKSKHSVHCGLPTDPIMLCLKTRFTLPLFYTTQ